VEIIEEALAFRHIRITGEEYAASPDGMKLFGVLRVDADYEGVGFAIGLRDSNDNPCGSELFPAIKFFAAIIWHSVRPYELVKGYEYINSFGVIRCCSDWRLLRGNLVQVP
jgi:hypothetical protein